MVDDKLAVPTSEEEVAAFIARYFDKYDELCREMASGERTSPGPIPSELIFELLENARYKDAWRLIALLLDTAPTDEALGFVAAADLEEIICFSTPPAEIYHAILERARTNDRVRTALGRMYWDGAPEWFRSEVKALGVVM